MQRKEEKGEIGRKQARLGKHNTESAHCLVNRIDSKGYAVTEGPGLELVYHLRVILRSPLHVSSKLALYHSFHQIGVGHRIVNFQFHSVWVAQVKGLHSPEGILGEFVEPQLEVDTTLVLRLPFYHECANDN